MQFTLFKITIFVEKYPKWSKFNYTHKTFDDGLDAEWETIVDVGLWRVHISK